MKKIKVLIVILSIFFINVGFVKADDHCDYTYNNKRVRIEIKNEKELGDINYGGDVLSYKAVILDSILDSSLTDEKIINTYFKNEDEISCPSYIYFYTELVKESDDGDSDLDNRYYILLDSSEVSNNVLVTLDSEYQYTFLYEKWTLLNYDESTSTAPSHKIIGECDMYTNLYNEITSSECYRNKCSSKEKSEYNKNIDELKAFCKNIMSKANYDNPCLIDCSELSADEFINSNDVGDCGFSSRFLAWVLNIFKWVKYIVPVIVILMGIVDFMRAIGSEKDDGLKKAQGRFVKRLIAAALIFIVPLILSFIIEKMGFIPEGCGIIDL